ncbi:glucosidase II beta subunit-like-domain-containing protein [Ephemerocybe angulata]|uniref:Glucosidase 2 subunit beta n=1 Tax=Ephemerocybe angulata TaxID=980116 RepID=A0A8H6IBH9_9AGAR|nr:glucosidase II beta subunit-like-domain-containing protein [Tulosesus angulatus]
MVPWLLLALPLGATAAAGRDKLLGVHPSALAKYTPSKSNTWKCLDGSKEISWNAVNDDYCDCPDGSDEPGTSACPDSRFWCKNEGHIGAYIHSSRVGDGLCETECCDGSDERPGTCPNRCKEIGEAYRAKRDAELKIQKTGSKIRSTYIAFAHKERKRLEDLAASLEKDIVAKEKEVEKLREIAERTESLTQAALDHKRQSPLYQSLLNHNKALKSLKREYKKHADREKQLGQILDSLRTGYNPNYQDMAVLEADGEESSTPEPESEKTEEAVDDGLWTADELDSELDDLIGTDYTSLLLEHEDHINTPTEDSLLFKITSYIPDAWLPQYEAWKDNFVDWLEKLGIVSEESSGSSTEATRAQQALTEANTELNHMRREKTESESDVLKIFNPEHFGAEGEWKKLDDTCINHEVGDYTYELCFFKEAKQKPNKGGSNFSLGRFQSWNKDARPGSPEYYSKQVYQHGTRCWNGPERSVVVLLTCGVENTIYSVQELEKCEYQFKGTSPALCLPPGKEPQNHEEL